MWQNAYDAYLESRVLSAEPVELVRMVYQAATGAVREARKHLAAGDIAARARSISYACEAVIELAASLDHQRGGALSARLSELYQYIVRRLVEANFEQQDAPLAEVESLLVTLSQAWEEARAKQVPGQPPEIPVAPAAVWQETNREPAAHGWSA